MKKSNIKEDILNDKSPSVVRQSSIEKGVINSNNV